VRHVSRQRGLGTYAAGVLTGIGRRWRAAVAVGVFGLLLAGSLWGTDDHFPFGPFSMYAGVNDPDGTTTRTRLMATTETGEYVFVPAAAIGLRRAEVEGQIPRFVERPELLADVATAHSRVRPHEPRYVEVELISREFRLRDSRSTGYRDRILAVWRARSP
jgi:hypothetical protein